MSDTLLVYSTETGRIKYPKEAISHIKGTYSKDLSIKNDGIVRIQRQTTGRSGKGVSVIMGLNLDSDKLSTLAAELKKRCGCGGSIKDGNIEIQGDKRVLLKDLLEKRGFSVKLAGG